MVMFVVFKFVVVVIVVFFNSVSIVGNSDVEG